MDVDYEILGWPPEGPSLRLDWRRFSYAGKFVMTNTGKAVARVEDDGSGRSPVVSAGETNVDSGRSRGTDDRDADGSDDATLVAAVAFNEDRTNPGTLWLRYVTVRADRRGNGIGPRLIEHVCDRAADRGYDRLRIAVNNPFAYEALARAGFGYTGETTGIAEVVLERSAAQDTDCATDANKPSNARYRRGLEEFRDRDLTDDERAFLEEKLERGPPDRLE